MELNRRLVTAYTHFKEDPRIIQLRANVTAYNRELRMLNLRDHQVEYAKFSFPQVVGTLLYRLAKLVVLTVGALPGSILFAPVFAATKIISIKKAREALKASTVKIQGRDVMATWKLLVALAFAPILYQFYVILLVYWIYKDRIFGLAPEWLPLWSVPVVGWILFPAITFAALRFGEVGMDIFKSLRPLLLSLNPSSANTLTKLKNRREQLSIEVTDLINTLGPEIFPDFESTRILANPFGVGDEKPDAKEKYQYGMTYTTQGYQQAPDISIHQGDPDYSPPGELNPHHHDAARSGSHLIPRNESFSNLSNIGLFASRPASRARSRSNSGRHDFSAFSKLSQRDPGGEDTDEMVKNIGDKLAERRRERVRRKSESEYELRPTEDDASGDDEGESSEERGRSWEDGSETGVSVDGEGDLVEVRKRR